MQRSDSKMSPTKLTSLPSPSITLTKSMDSSTPNLIRKWRCFSAHFSSVSFLMVPSALLLWPQACLLLNVHYSFGCFWCVLALILLLNKVVLNSTGYSSPLRSHNQFARRAYLVLSSIRPLHGALYRHPGMRGHSSQVNGDELYMCVCWNDALALCSIRFSVELFNQILVIV